MNFKDLIAELFGFDKTILDLNVQLRNLDIQSQSDKQLIDQKNQEIELQKEEIRNLNAKIIIPDQLEDYWNNKYNKASITYEGRSLPFSKDKCVVPVNVLITPSDPFIIEDLKKWNLYRTGEDPETLIPKIYQKIHDTYYNYDYDKNVWGVDEVWEFPFEMRDKAGSGKWAYDCDSWSGLILSYYIAAGIPRWRVRVVAGMCSLGGHSTVYCFSKTTNKWHHTNSTYGLIYDVLAKYPVHDDAVSESNPKGRDALGIYNVWFSYNDLYAWYRLDEDLPKEVKKI